VNLRLVLAALLLANSAFAQSVARPAVRPGDQWQFVESAGLTGQLGRAWVVNAVTAAGIEGTENGAPLRLSPDLGIFDLPRISYSNPVPLRFPLAVGQSWRYATNWVSKTRNASGNAVYNVAVVAYERIRVPAGEFDAFRVVSKADMQGVAINVQLDADIDMTYWYAPAARMVVKAITDNPYVGTTTLELVSYRLEP